MSLGETNPDSIRRNVQEAVNGQYSVFCLGFGFDVHYPFLEKLAQDNGGLARRIYEDSDSALQLQVPVLSKAGLGQPGRPCLPAFCDATPPSPSPPPPGRRPPPLRTSTMK